MTFVLTFKSVEKDNYWLKTTEQNIPEVLFIMLYKTNCQISES